MAELTRDCGCFSDHLLCRNTRPRVLLADCLKSCPKPSAQGVRPRPRHNSSPWRNSFPSGAEPSFDSEISLTEILALQQQAAAAVQGLVAELEGSTSDAERALLAQLDELAELRADLFERQQQVSAVEDEFRRSRDQSSASDAMLRQRELAIAQRESQVETLEGQLQASVAELEQTQQNWLAEQSGIEKELAARQQKLDAERAALDASRQQLEADAQHAGAANNTEQAGRIEQLEREHGELLTRLEQLTAARAELAQLKSQLANSDHDSGSLRAQLGQVRQERDELLSQLTDLSTQVEELARNSSNPDIERRLGEQLSQLQADLTEARRQTSRMASAAIDLADARAEILQLREELDGTRSMASEELHSRVDQLLQERNELELELETVRNRASELLDDAEEERRRMSEERAHWAGELRQLRRALETQSQLLSEREAALQSIPPSIAAAAPQAGAGVRANKDPVLDAVMAQFQQLQKDRIQRRNGGHGKQEVA